MNLLVVCHYGLYQDFSYSFVHHQAAAYAALGHHVRVLVPIPVGKAGPSGRRFLPGLECRTADGVEIVYLRFLSLSNYGRAHFNTSSAIAALEAHLSELLRGFQPDVIHAHTLGFDSELGAWLKDWLHVPLIVTTHGSDTSNPMEQGEGAQLKRFCDHADMVAAVSSALADKLRACGTDTPIVSILNGFVLENVSQGIKQPYSLLQVGALTEQKRVFVTIRAFCTLRKQYPALTLTLIGQGPERGRLEEFCRELDVEDAVFFLGQLPHQDVLAEMAKVHFFAMPSVGEGFGIVYLEAMASGCVTVGTEGEGVADLIVSGENGFLVPPDDPEAIVCVVEWCLDHPEESAAIAEQGRRDALGLTWEKNAKQYIALFQSLTEEN